MLGREDLESLIENGIDRGYFTLATVRHVATAAGGRGRPGSARLSAVLAARDPVRRPVRSDYELRLERAMRRRGFPPLVREHRLELSSGESDPPLISVCRTMASSSRSTISHGTADTSVWTMTRDAIAGLAPDSAITSSG